MILIIDNYDSFVYNLVCYVNLLGFSTLVVRNDKIDLETVADIKPSHIILSPGPGVPKEAGICLTLVKRFYREMPILGICLGHQAIAEAFGGKIVRAQQPMHGKQSRIVHSASGLLSGFESPLPVGRYHSLVVEKSTFPACLLQTSLSKAGEVMSLAHRQHPVFGLQFHPESILTPQGSAIVERFLVNFK